MPSIGTRLKRESSDREEFLGTLAKRVSVPTANWPTVRCWTKGSLDQLFKTIKDDREGSASLPSNAELIHWMEHLGLAYSIEADGTTFFLLELGAGPTSEVDPLELMMAYEPSGTICYFSALMFHSLTSQIPSHHHLAVLTESPTNGAVQDSKNTPQQQSRHKPAEEETVEKKDVQGKGRAIGKIVFSYSGIPYYLTRRTRRLVPGVQTRSNGPRGRFRITTFEQTLLDTLYKPQACGGPAVIFEAWRDATASGQLDEERLLKYLGDMHYPATSRRLGAMLQLMDYTPGAELANHLLRTRSEIDREGPYSEISLLPGFEYANLKDEWLVKLP